MVVQFAETPSVMLLHKGVLLEVFALRFLNFSRLA